MKKIKRKIKEKLKRWISFFEEGYRRRDKRDAEFLPNKLKKEGSKMKKLVFLAVVLVVGVFLASALYAGEIDLLLEKLVDKGVLTGAEAQQIKYETQEQVKKEIAMGKYSLLPAWVQNMKLKGDLRLRYQYHHEKQAGSYEKDTHIGRVRMRLGLETQINDRILAGIGIATNSSGDPRSTNMTFGSGGHSSKMEIRLDYGYAKYMPFSYLTLVGGKMLLGDVLWEPSDLIWDTDITPEGAVASFNKDVTDNVGLFMNIGILPQTADTSDNADPINLYLLQPGASFKLNENVKLKGAFTYYNFSNTKNTAYPTGSWYKSSNTKSGSNWAYDYRLISPVLELSIKEPFKAFGISFLDFESLKFFGEYVNNTAVDKKNTGFSLGFKLGKDKVERWGDWQFKYIYAMLGKDATLDTTPDSDRYGGRTAIRSHEGALSFGLSKNTSLDFDVYRSWRINGNAKAPETLVQVDWNLKF